jgi:transcriptional regulator with XRE-family HTH domain
MEITVARINELAENKGSTIRELAEIAGCSKSAMQRYLAGDRDMPTNVIVGLAKAFNVHAAYLFGWVDDKNYMPNNQKQPVGNELSEVKQALIDLIDGLSENEAAVLLASLKSGLGR